MEPEYTEAQSCGSVTSSHCDGFQKFPIVCTKHPYYSFKSIFWAGLFILVECCTGFLLIRLTHANEIIMRP